MSDYYPAGEHFDDPAAKNSYDEATNILYFIQEIRYYAETLESSLRSQSPAPTRAIEELSAFNARSTFSAQILAMEKGTDADNAGAVFFDTLTTDIHADLEKLCQEVKKTRAELERLCSTYPGEVSARLKEARETSVDVDESCDQWVLAMPHVTLGLGGLTIDPDSAASIPACLDESGNMDQTK